MSRDGIKEYADKRDWSEYNEKLVRRGELYLNAAWLDSWDREIEEMNNHKIGRPYEFPDSLMDFLAQFRQLLRVRFRQLEGFLKSILRLSGDRKAADYTTIWWRLSEREAPSLVVSPGNGPVVIAVDSTGIKVTNRGEWMREKWHRRRGWIKVHLVVDTRGNVLAVKSTDERVGDSRMFPILVEEAEGTVGMGRIVEALADGAYDTRENFQFLEDRGIRAGIRIKAGATCKSKGSSARPRAVRELRALGEEKWKEMHGYGRRWSAEWTISAVKRIFGESVMSRRRDLMFKEVGTMFALYSILLQI